MRGAPFTWIGLDWIGLDWIDEESAGRRGHNFSSLESLLTLFLSCRASQTFQNTTMTNAMTMKLATISCRGIAGGSKSVRVPIRTTKGMPTIKKYRICRHIAQMGSFLSVLLLMCQCWLGVKATSPCLRTVGFQSYSSCSHWCCSFAQWFVAWPRTGLYNALLP